MNPTHHVSASHPQISHRAALWFSIVPHRTALCLLSLILFFAATTTASAATIQAQHRPWAQQSGLVGYWSFDSKDMTDKVYDRSGRGNNGYVVGGATSSVKVPGKTGQGLVMGTHIIAPPAASVNNLNQMTLAMWVKAAAGSQPTIIEKGYTLNTNGWRLEDSGTLMFRATFGISNGWWSTDYNYRNYNVNNEWTHVAVTYDYGSPTTLPTFYINGVATTTVTALFTPNGARDDDSVENLSIGARENQSASVSNNLLDEVRIYNRMLSAAEVKALYGGGGIKIAKPRTGVANGLVGWWTMDGNDVTDKVYDRSGQGKHGYVVDEATTSVKQAGKVGQGIRLSDAGYISAPSPVSSYPASGCAWVKYVEGAGSIPGIIKIGNGLQFHLQIGVGDTDKIYLYNDNDMISSSLGSVHENDWYHACFTAAADGTANLYINGAVAATEKNIGVSASLSSFRISGRVDFGESLNALIDEVRIYNRVLSANEVKQIYNEGVGAMVAKSQLSKVPGGLVGYWSFNGPDFADKVYDRSGQNYHAYVTGSATSTVKSPGKVGQGVSLSGSNYISTNLAFGSLVGATAMTASVWVKTASLASYEQFVGVGDCSGTDGNSVFEFGGGYNAADKPEFVIYKQGGSPVYYSIASTVAIADNEWHMVTGTYDGAFVRIYVDGVSAGTPVAANSITVPYPDRVLDIGVCNSAVTPDYHFDGKLDEVRVYNRALSAAEVKQLYNFGR